MPGGSPHVLKSYTPMTKDPIQLINETDGRFSVCRHGAEMLRTFEKPLGVLVMAGRYRTGKSFLLNRCILGVPPRSGFQTGSTVQSCTKGIWMHPVPHAIKGKTFVVLDTEGTASLDASAQHDARLIGISLALASVFCYNGTGNIDEAALSDLGVIATVASGISAGDDIWDPPCLAWVLRDFALELVDRNGVPQTPDEYLEASLAMSSTFDLGNLLRSTFPVRKLCTFVRPVLDEAKLQKLNASPKKELRLEFVSDMTRFLNVLGEVAMHKTLKGDEVSGAALVRLAEIAVEAANSGSAPVVRDAFGFMMQEKVDSALTGARGVLEAWKRELDLPLAKLRLPEIPEPSLSGSMLQGFLKVLASLREEAMREAEEANRAAAARWAQQWLASTEGQDILSLRDRFLECRRRLGDGPTCDHLPVLLDNCTRAQSASVRETQDRLEEATAGLAAVMARYEEAKVIECLLRQELEALRTVPPPTVTSASDHEFLQNAVRKEVEELVRERDELLVKLQNNTNDAPSSPSAQQDPEARMLPCPGASSLEDGLRLELRELREIRDREAHSLAALHDGHEGDLKSLRSDLLQTLERYKEQHRQDLRDLETRACQAETQAKAVAKDLAAAQIETRDRAKQYREAVDRHAQELQTARVSATQAMSDRARITKEHQDTLMEELRRTRDTCATAERKMVRLEVEHESMKRRLDASDEDRVEMRKMQKTNAELRGRLSEKEATLKALGCEDTEHRCRISKLEAKVREQDEMHMTARREATIKLARLEVEVAAAKTC